MSRMAEARLYLSTKSKKAVARAFAASDGIRLVCAVFSSPRCNCSVVIIARYFGASFKAKVNRSCVAILFLKTGLAIRAAHKSSGTPIKCSGAPRGACCRACLLCVKDSTSFSNTYGKWWSLLMP